jgi:hypothetical protein
MSESVHDYFGPVISVYTRAQAFEDGVLVDLAGHESTNVFKFPVAFTAALWAEVERGDGKRGEVMAARIWDICYMSTVSTAQIEGPDSFYPVIVGAKTLRLRCNCGPGDDAAPVITIGFPEDF